jgi:integrase
MRIMPYKHYGKWRARWIDAAGKQCSRNFDDHRSADYFEKRMKAEAEEVRRGARLAVPARRLFGELCDHWLVTRAARKRSRVDDESIIRRHLRPAFGTVPLDQVGVADAECYIASHAHLNKKTIANHLTLLIAMLNFARDLGWLERVPRIKKPRVRAHGQDYQYLRTDADIRRFLAAAAEEEPMVHALYATAVYTGARAGELAALRWDDVDFAQRLITIQRSFDGPTKAEDVRHVPIVDVLLPVLREWRLRNPLPIAFPNQAGRMQGESARVFQEVLHRVLHRAGFPAVERGDRARPFIRFHDLRHTFASHWVMRGGDLFKLQKVLGHKSVQMTMRYAHLAPHAFADDFARFGSPQARGEVVELVARAGSATAGT